MKKAWEVSMVGQPLIVFLPCIWIKLVAQSFQEAIESSDCGFEADQYPSKYLFGIYSTNGTENLLKISESQEIVSLIFF